MRLKLLSIACFIFGLSACQTPYTYTAKVADSSVGVSSEVTPSKQIEGMIAPYKQQLDEQMNEVIGQAEVDLTREFDKGESLLGNFCADLLYEQAKKYGGADFSVITIGGLRVPIAKGDITVRLIYELMPFDNEFVIITIDGATAKKLINRLHEYNNTSLGNVNATIRRKKVVTATIGGKEIDPKGTYRLALSDYLANGGDYMDILKSNSASEATGVKVRDVIINHIKDLTKEGEKAAAQIGSCITFE